MRLIDLTGQRFGRLTVIERAPDQDGRHKAWWYCQCVCGAWRTALGEHLRNGKTNSCRTGCTFINTHKPWPGDSRFLVGEDGTIVGPSGRPLRTFTDKNGYLRFNVHRDGQWTQVGVHVVVCETFHGPRPEGMHAAHGNGVKGDCSATNLAWKTPTENEADKVGHDTRAWGERHGMRKLTEADVRAIRASPESSYIVAGRYGIVSATVRMIRRRKTWRHVA